jgi:hypothetical protein
MGGVVEIQPRVFGLKDDAIELSHISTQLEAKLNAASVSDGQITEADLHPDLVSKLNSSSVNIYNDTDTMMSDTHSAGRLALIPEASGNGQRLFLRNNSMNRRMSLLRTFNATATWATEPPTTATLSLNIPKVIQFEAQDPQNSPITYSLVFSGPDGFDFSNNTITNDNGLSISVDQSTDNQIVFTLNSFPDMAHLSGGSQGSNAIATGWPRLSSIYHHNPKYFGYQNVAFYPTYLFDNTMEYWVSKLRGFFENSYPYHLSYIRHYSYNDFSGNYDAMMSEEQLTDDDQLQIKFDQGKKLSKIKILPSNGFLSAIPGFRIYGSNTQPSKVSSFAGMDLLYEAGPSPFMFLEIPSDVAAQDFIEEAHEFVIPVAARNTYQYYTINFTNELWESTTDQSNQLYQSPFTYVYIREMFLYYDTEVYDNVFTLQVNANDGVNILSKTMTLSLNQPVWTTEPESSYTLYLNSPLSIPFEATDPNGGAVTYSVSYLSSLPNFNVGSSSLVSDNGLFVTYDDTNQQVDLVSSGFTQENSSFTVRIEVTDSFNATIRKDIQINIGPTVAGTYTLNPSGANADLPDVLRVNHLGTVLSGSTPFEFEDDLSSITVNSVVLNLSSQVEYVESQLCGGTQGSNGITAGWPRASTVYGNNVVVAYPTKLFDNLIADYYDGWHSLFEATGSSQAHSWNDATDSYENTGSGTTISNDDQLQIKFNEARRISKVAMLWRGNIPEQFVKALRIYGSNTQPSAVSSYAGMDLLLQTDGTGYLEPPATTYSGNAQDNLDIAVSFVIPEENQANYEYYTIQFDDIWSQTNNEMTITEMFFFHKTPIYLYQEDGSSYHYRKTNQVTTPPTSLYLPSSTPTTLEYAATDVDGDILYDISYTSSTAGFTATTDSNGDTTITNDNGMNVSVSNNTTDRILTLNSTGSNGGFDIVVTVNDNVNAPLQSTTSAIIVPSFTDSSKLHLSFPFKNALTSADALVNQVSGPDATTYNTGFTPGTGFIHDSSDRTTIDIDTSISTFPLTIFMRFYRTDTGDNHNTHLFESTFDDSPSIRYYQDGSNSNLLYRVGHVTDLSNIFTDYNGFQVGRWTNTCMVLDSNFNMILYTDSSYSGTMVKKHEKSYIQENLLISKLRLGNYVLQSNPGSGDAFNGNISDFYVFKEALSESDVQNFTDYINN